MNKDIAWRSPRRLIAVALLAIGGCGPSHSTGDGGMGAAGGISAAEYPARHIAARCQWLVACGLAPDLDTCVAASLPYVRVWSSPMFQRDVAAGKIAYDAGRAAACLASYNSAACTKTWEASSGTTFGPVSQTCDSVFTGTVATGAACQFNAECKPGAECNPIAADSVGDCRPGKCYDRFRTVPLGGSCSDADPSLPIAICAPGTYCNVPVMPPICVAVHKEIGAPCITGMACTPPLFCSNATSTCVSPSVRGAPCAPNGAECEDERDVCDGTCVAPVAVGAPCPSTAPCPLGTHCRSDGAQMTCAAGLPPGADCSGEDAGCLLDLVCDPTTRTCMLPQEDQTCQ